MKRFGIVFPILIISFALLLYVFPSLYELESINWIEFTLINMGILSFCVLLYFLINGKYIKDLNLGTKKIIIETVQEKQDKTSYEAGSGALHIPILGNLFPKIWSQEMKPKYVLYLIINNTRYEVRKDVFNQTKKGDLVEIHYSQFSNTRLDIKKKTSHLHQH